MKDIIKYGGGDNNLPMKGINAKLTIWGGGCLFDAQK